MDALNRFFHRKHEAYNHHRPCYPVAQYMSYSNATSLKNARHDLQSAYNKEMAKPHAQRNSDLLYEMDKALYP